MQYFAIDDTVEVREAKRKFYSSLPPKFDFKKSMEDHHFTVISNYHYYVQRFYKFSQLFQDKLQTETQLHIGKYVNPFTHYTITSWGYCLLGHFTFRNHNLKSIKKSPLASKISVFQHAFEQYLHYKNKGKHKILSAFNSAECGAARLKNIIVDAFDVTTNVC